MKESSREMPDKNEIQNELRNKAPMLADLKGKLDRPEVPEGYFESLEDRLSNKVFESKKGNKVHRLWWYGSVAVAASIALFFLFRVPTAISTDDPIEMSDSELVLLDQMDALELEYFLVNEEDLESFDPESLLLEEDHLEELLNI